MSSRLLAPSQGRDSKHSPALVPKNEKLGGEGGGESEKGGEEDKVW